MSSDIMAATNMEFVRELHLYHITSCLTTLPIINAKSKDNNRHPVSGRIMKKLPLREKVRKDEGLVRW